MARDYMVVNTVLSGWKIVPYNAFNRMQYGTGNFIGDYDSCLNKLKEIQNGN